MPCQAFLFFFFFKGNEETDGIFFSIDAKKNPQKTPHQKNPKKQLPNLTVVEANLR